MQLRDFDGRQRLAPILGLTLTMACIGCDDSVAELEELAVPGNLDTPEADACRDASPLLEGLSSGWVERYEDRWTLRVTSVPEAFDWSPQRPPSTKCPEYGWELLLDLPASTMDPGTYDFQTDLVGQMESEVRAVWKHGGGCLFSETGGSLEGMPIPGTLTVESVANGCVTGRMSGVNDIDAMPPVIFDGGFQALIQ